MTVQDNTVTPPPPPQPENRYRLGADGKPSPELSGIGTTLSNATSTATTALGDATSTASDGVQKGIKWLQGLDGYNIAGGALGGLLGWLLGSVFGMGGWMGMIVSALFVPAGFYMGADKLGPLLKGWISGHGTSNTPTDTPANTPTVNRGAGTDTLTRDPRQRDTQDVYNAGQDYYRDRDPRSWDGREYDGPPGPPPPPGYGYRHGHGMFGVRVHIGSNNGFFDPIDNGGGYFRPYDNGGGRYSPYDNGGAGRYSPIDNGAGGLNLPAQGPNPGFHPYDNKLGRRW